MSDEGYTLSKSAVEKTAKTVRRVLGDHGVVYLPTLGDAFPEDGELDVKVTSSASGGGKYIVSWLKPATNDVAETGNLALSDIGTETTTDVWWTKLLAVNTAEVGKSTHAVAVGTVVRASVKRLQDNKTIVLEFTYAAGSLPTGSINDTLICVDSTGVFTPGKPRLG